MHACRSSISPEDAGTKPDSSSEVPETHSQVSRQTHSHSNRQFAPATINDYSFARHAAAARTVVVSPAVTVESPDRKKSHGNIAEKEVAVVAGRQSFANVTGLW